MGQSLREPRTGEQLSARAGVHQWIGTVQAEITQCNTHQQTRGHRSRSPASQVHRALTGRRPSSTGEIDDIAGRRRALSARRVNKALRHRFIQDSRE
jgi:hypothetical protein